MAKKCVFHIYCAEDAIIMLFYYRTLECVAKANHQVLCFYSYIIIINNVHKAKFISYAYIIVACKSYTCTNLPATIKTLEAFRIICVIAEEVILIATLISIIVNFILILTSNAISKVRTKVDLQLGIITEIVTIRSQDRNFQIHWLCSLLLIIIF